MTPPGNGPDHEIRIDRPAAGSHRTTLVVDGRAIDTLEDLPPLRNRLLFVGLNPSPVSVEAGHYHQGPLGRLFWARLIEAHILPADIDPEAADDALLAEGHGITDLLKRPSAPDDASDNALRAGVGPLWQKIAIWRPAAVVFIYKRAAQIAAGRRLDAKWGQLQGVALAGRPCFLMPGPDAPKPQVDAGLNFLRNLGSALPYD